MDNREFLTKMQTYVANIAISGSTLRNQGASGVVRIAREFLACLDLAEIKLTVPTEYPVLLDKWTKDLQRLLPRGAKHWGTARKAINVFMVQAAMNRFLCDEFKVDRLAGVLETPLDSKAAAELRRRAPHLLSPWPGIKDLVREVSDPYQRTATQMAQQNGLKRGYLDVLLWKTG